MTGGDLETAWNVGGYEMARDGRKRGESRNESLLAWWARRAGNVGVEDEGLGQALGSRWRASLLTEPLPGRAPDRRALRARRSALLRAYLACIPYTHLFTSTCGYRPQI
jgi:hypothetical protein